MGLLVWLQKLGRCLHKPRQRGPPWHGTALKALPCPEWAVLRGCRPLPLQASSPKPRHSLCSSNRDTRYSPSPHISHCAPAKGVSPKWSFGMTFICCVMGFQPSISDIPLGCFLFGCTLQDLLTKGRCLHMSRTAADH